MKRVIWIKTAVVLALAMAVGTLIAEGAGGIGDRSRQQQPGHTLPGTITQPVPFPELHSVVLWLPQINLGGPQPAQTPNAVPGGTEARGMVFLTRPAVGDAVITLASANPGLLHVQATVTVASGQQTVQFRYDPLPVATPTAVTVSASYRGQTKTASVTILPPQVQTLTLDPAQLEGGQPSRGTVTLSGRGPSGTPLKVGLASNSPAAQVPAEVTLSGNQQAQFSIATKGVSPQTPILISASLAGSARQASLTVTPASLRLFGWYQMQASQPVWFESIDCHPQGQSGNHVYGGKIPLVARLSGPAPYNADAVVLLTSSHPSLLPVPATLAIGANAAQAATELTCPSPSATTRVEITAAYLGVTKKYSVTVKPLLLPDLTVSAILYDAGNNVITRPTNPQPFRFCGKVAQSSPPGTVSQTKLRMAYKHSRGFGAEAVHSIDVWSSTPQACRMIEGLEIGEYVDFTMMVDPANATPESNEANNTQQFRVTR